MTDPLATAPAAPRAGTPPPTVVPPEPARPAADRTTPAPPDDPAYRATLRWRLRALAVLQCVNALSFLPFVIAGRDEQFTPEMIGPVGLWAGGAFTVLNAAVAVALTVRRDWSVRHMRRMDAAVLVALTVALAGWHYTRLVRSAGLPSDGPNHRQLRVEAANFHAGLIWFICPLIYGVAVPGPTWWQAARFFPVATAAVFAVSAAAAGSAEVAARLPLLLTPTAGLTYTAAAVVVYGSHRVNALAAQVSAARKELAALGQYQLGRRLGAGGMGRCSWPSTGS